MKILTTKSVYYPNRNYEDDVYIDALIQEQEITLESLLGCDPYEDTYLIKFGCGAYETLGIDTALQCLSIKDGCDLVRFDNGNIGFQAYYNGIQNSKNRFEIICKYDEIAGRFYKQFEKEIGTDDFEYEEELIDEILHQLNRR